MPGIENFAPDRTDTSSGFFVSPSLRPADLLELPQVVDHLFLDRRGNLAAFLVVDRADGRRDREACRHRQLRVGHLREARAFAAEQILHAAIAIGLAVAEVVDVLARLGELRDLLGFGRGFGCLLQELEYFLRHSTVYSVSETISEMSAIRKICCSRRFMRRRRAFRKGAVIYHHEDFGEESIDCRTELGCLDKCAAQIFPRFEHAVNHGAAPLKFFQQRDFRWFLEQLCRAASILSSRPCSNRRPAALARCSSLA